MTPPASITVPPSALTQTLLHTGPPAETVTLPHDGSPAQITTLELINSDTVDQAAHRLLDGAVITNAMIGEASITTETTAERADRLFNQAVHTTRLKMTLHNVTPLESSGHDPLTRCTFGAVYSANPTEEDFVYGNATPYGSLSYNVRSDIAEHLVVGQAYYIDIHPVPL